MYLLLIGIIIILLYVVYNWCNDIEIKYLDSGIIGPTLLIIAGVHGNEPAGSIYLKKHFKISKPKKGSIYIIHSPNKLGLLFNNRYLLHRFYHRDLNRNFPKKDGETAKEPISIKICEIVNKCDWVLDMHEGWGFMVNGNGSMGSGIFPGNTTNSLALSKLMLDNLHEINYPEFILTPNHNIQINTLKNYCIYKNKHYVLIETSGQNNIQPLHVRLTQIETIIMTTLKYLKMI
jgi:hypothetical protein